MTQSWKNRKIGALWVTKSTKTNKKYLQGEICLDGKITKILILKNLSKNQSHYPDYEIFVTRNEIAKEFLDDEPDF